MNCHQLNTPLTPLSIESPLPGPCPSPGPKAVLIPDITNERARSSHPWTNTVACLPLTPLTKHVGEMQLS